MDIFQLEVTGNIDVSIPNCNTKSGNHEELKLRLVDFLLFLCKEFPCEIRFIRFHRLPAYPFDSRYLHRYYVFICFYMFILLSDIDETAEHWASSVYIDFQVSSDFVFH